MNWRHRIAFDPNVCDGLACIKGTRVLVSVVLDNLAEFASVDEILASYQMLSREDIDASVCRQENRALDFADGRSYPPEAYSGLIVMLEIYGNAP